MTEIDRILEDFRLRHDVVCWDDITEQTEITKAALQDLILREKIAVLEGLLKHKEDRPIVTYSEFLRAAVARVEGMDTPCVPVPYIEDRLTELQNQLKEK